MSVLSQELILQTMNQINKVGWTNFYPFQLVIDNPSLSPLPFNTRYNFLKHVNQTWHHQLCQQIPEFKTNANQDRASFLFDVIMTRFDLMTPYKSTLQHIWQHTFLADSELLQLLPEWLNNIEFWVQQILTSPHFLIHQSQLKVFLYYYYHVQSTWFDDQSPDLSSTMRILDEKIVDYLSIIS